MGNDSAFQERLLKADHLTFRALFNKFYRPLVGFFVKRGCSETESEDLVQEVLLNAFRGLTRFRRDASDATWIFSIAANIWRNYLRTARTQKRAATAALSLDQLDGDEIERRAADATESTTVLDQILDHEQRRQLHSAIRELPTGRRQALHLRVVHGLKYREIARLLDIEVNTVKSQIFQARRQLEVRLGSHSLEAARKDEA